MKSALTSASGSVRYHQSCPADSSEADFTFSFVQFRIQREGDLGFADIHELVLVVFDATKLSDDFLQDIISRWANV